MTRYTYYFPYEIVKLKVKDSKEDLKVQVYIKSDIRKNPPEDFSKFTCASCGLKWDMETKDKIDVCSCPENEKQYPAYMEKMMAKRKIGQELAKQYWSSPEGLSHSKKNDENSKVMDKYWKEYWKSDEGRNKLISIGRNPIV